MKNIALFILLNLFVWNVYSQNRNNIWQLGGLQIYNEGIDFNPGFADTFSLVRQMPFFITDASICDGSGQILFYTNGVYIANRNHDTLLYSTDFNPGFYTTQNNGLGITQGCIIVPIPGDINRYYIFHESAEWLTNDMQPINLSYTVVDMTLDSGLGAVDTTIKSIHLIEDTLTNGRIAAVKHGNGRDWWLICHKYMSDIYYEFLISPSGISGPQIQQIGSLINQIDQIGQAIFSPDGNHFAITGPQNVLDVMDFDRCTGDFYNCRTATIPDQAGAQGCSFSPNNRFIYVSTYTNIFQYDIWATNLAASVILVAPWDTFYSPFETYFCLQQLAPDGRIYISTWTGTNILHYIEFPDSLGTACNVVQNSFIMPSYSTADLPNSPNWELGPVIGSICDSLGLTVEEYGKFNFKLETFPNPNNGNFRLSYVLPKNKEGKLEIYNMMSEKVYETRLPQWSSVKDVNLTGVSPGVYVVRLTSDEKSAFVKLLLE